MNKKTLLRLAGLSSQYVIPPICPGCLKLLPIDSPLSPFCPECRSAWEREKLLRCRVCGLAVMDCICVPTVMADAGVDLLVARVPYRAGGGSVPDRVLFSIKEEKRPEVFRFLARELRGAVLSAIAERECSVKDAVLTALPRRPSAVRRYGFDQAVVLGRAISLETGIPYQTLLYRYPFTAEAKTLSAEERKENSKSAFYTRIDGNALSGKTVFLVDDLVTTGNGLASGAELLYALGANEVVGVVVGRTAENKTVRHTSAEETEKLAKT